MLFEFIFFSFLLLSTVYSLCGKGYVDYRMANKCVKIIEKEMKFLDAMEQCMQEQRDHHGSLVSVHSQEQNDQLIELALDTTCENGEIWIGFAYYANGSPEYVWADGSDVDFVNWASGYPDRGTQDAWAFLQPYVKKWHSVVNPDIKKCFACEYDQTSTLPPGWTTVPVTTQPAATTSSLPACSYGWTPYGTNCYVVMMARGTWRYSLNACENREDVSSPPYFPTLASIHSMEETQFLVDNWLKYRPWIGLEGMPSSDSPWAWSDYTAFDFTNWDRTDRPTGTCVIVDSNGLWHQRNCSEWNYFLCKYNRNVIPAHHPDNFAMAYRMSFAMVAAVATYYLA